MEWSVTEFKESHTDICGQTLLWRWHSSCFQSHLDFLEAGGWTQQIKYLHKNESNAYLKNCRCCDYYGIPDLECENLSLWSEASLTSFRFCNKSSNLSLALFAMTLFLSASYWRCVLSMLMLRFRATLTKAVISFMAGKKRQEKFRKIPGEGGGKRVNQNAARSRKVTCKCARMPECSDLGVRQAGEQRDDRVHHVLIIDDAVLTVTDQNGNKIAEAYAEFLPLWSWQR